MHVDIVPNRTSRPAILLREAWREDGRVRKRTVANLTGVIDEEQALLLRRVLKGEALVAPADAFEITRSLPHGHVQAVLLALKRLGVERLLASRPSKERSLIAALVAFRVLSPKSKLATTRAWLDTTLAAELGVQDADEHAVYHAMDWLVSRQARIEGKLAARHLSEGSRVLFDLSSTYVEGEKCDLAAFGYDRDKKRGKKQINFGLLTDAAGRPIALSVFPGNTGDPSTLMPQVAKLKEQYGLNVFTLVGDRGMITGKHLPALRAAGVDWVTALKSQSLRKLVVDGVIQPSLFEEENLAEVTHADYPGERLIACRNPVLGRQRAHKRQELLTATIEALTKVQQSVRAGRLKGKARIGLRVGEKLAKYRMGKHLKLDIQDDKLSFEVDQDSVAAEAAMDGIYVIRTSVLQIDLSAPDAVRAYKRLAEVEKAFRTKKSIDLQVRPIHHHLPDRVKAHLFICMLAYYVRWHMERAWASLTFRDEETNQERDPVAAAKRSTAAAKKAQTNTLADGSPARSFKGLLEHMSTITLNTCKHPGTGVSFPMTTRPNATQQKALDLLANISV
ncbi:MAG: IS1634 family transposase [Truepera sp.]|jgi:transposase|nr:IS1634 family transposase [Truepera sp.]